MAKSGKLKVPAEHALVAERFRLERQSERFGQAELAAEIGVTRPTISNFEYGVSRVSFAAGFAFCRRLDLNPRWLATGEEPKRPFPEVRELGITEKQLCTYRKRGVDFLAGYSELLEKPIETWLKKMPIDRIIQRQLDGGPQALARRLSNHELESRLVEMACGLKSEKDERAEMKLAWAKNVEAILTEIKTRLVSRYPWLRDGSG